MFKWKVIGISGVTCGGKSCLAKSLVIKYPDSVLINQDDFFRTPDDPNHQWIDISPNIRHQNWESMISIDWEAFNQAVQQILANDPPSQKVLIIEGHLIFNFKPISDLCQKKYFITLSKEECFARREQRVDYIPKDPKGYFEACIWPMYSKNMNHMIAIQNDIPIEYFDGNSDKEVILENVLKSLDQIM